MSVRIFPPEKNPNYMTLLFSPAIGSAIWIGGGGIGLCSSSLL